MGHSFGGLITQLLLNRGLGASAVAISPAQIKGVYILPLAQAKVASVALKNPANRLQDPDAHTGGVPLRLHQPPHTRGVEADLRQARGAGAGAHALPGGVRERHAPRGDDGQPAQLKPRAAAVPRQRQGPTPWPQWSTRAAYKIQKKTGALTELKEYPDRSHYTFAQDGWEEVADYSLDWAVRNART